MLGSFDRVGYLRHQRRFAPGDLEVDLAGRTCLVTGANAGLGRATAEGLARLGATVHLLCRDAGRGEAARDELRRSTGLRSIESAAVDLSDLGSLRRYVEGARFGRVHALVHNAGVLPASRQVSPDGLELTFATHVAGPHLLTSLLRAPLEASGDARVVFVSSGGMYTQRLSFEDLAWERRRYDGVVAYAQTKRMQVVLAERWARRLSAKGVHVYSMHPGWADTGGVRTSLPRFHRLTAPILRSAEEGADTAVWLVARSEAPRPDGGFFFDREARWPHYLPWTREEEAEREELWRLCQRSVGLAG